MAGMFYSLKETAEKLKKTEEQVRKLAKQGKLRELRDGQNVLFKTDEVDALAIDEGVPIEMEGLKQETPTPTEQEQPIEPEQPVTPVAKQPTQPEQSPQPPEDEPTAEQEISLAPEPGAPAAESGMTDADTALTGEGISVLNKTDKGYSVTDDTMAETVAAAGATGTAGTVSEMPVEEIEEDVTLDTLGSGSGLLDLSLQADDTSLGGVLDEIYTAEGEGEAPAEPGTAEQLATEAEILSEEEVAAPQLASEVAAIAHPYAEPEPDTQSDALGILLLLPLVLLIYTAIVTIAGQRGVVPTILAKIQGFIWYIVFAAFVIAGLIVGAAFMLGGNFSTALKKPAKTKSPKKSKKGKEAHPPTPE